MCLLFPLKVARTYGPALYRVGWDGAVVLSNNTPRFRSCRKLLRKGLGASAVQSFVPFLNRQSAFYLRDLLDRPDAFPDIFKRCVIPGIFVAASLTATGRNAAAISMKIAYGYDGITEDEEIYHLARKANHHFAETAVVGVWLVDMISIRTSYHIRAGRELAMTMQ